jgi:glutathione synthase/RimK-type ligase-like ATP-grasp enzyme
LDYGGIDLMKNNKNEWVVLEVNRACQFEGFESATGINVASRIVDYLAN